MQPRARDLKGLPAGGDGGDGHAILGNRTGLVGADDAGAPQCFHAVQAVHQCAVLHHPAHRQRQRNGHRGGQSLRNGSDGDGDAGHEHVEHRFAPQNAGEEHRSADPQTEQRHYFPQTGEPLLQGCHILPDIL